MKKTIVKILNFSVFDSKTFFHRTTSEIGYKPFDREFDSTHSYGKKSKETMQPGYFCGLETLLTLVFALYERIVERFINNLYIQN